MKVTLSLALALSCALLFGCASARFSLPVDVTSTPSGAQIWTVPNPVVNKNFGLLKKGHGAFSGGQSTICVGTTPYKGLIDVTSNGPGHWYMQWENNAGSLLHYSTWWLYPIIPIHSGGAETHLRFTLKYPNGVSQEIIEPVTDHAGVSILFWNGLPSMVQNALATAVRQLPRDGIRRHYNAGPMPAGLPVETYKLPQAIEENRGDSAVINERLQKLKKLKDDGLITDEEYENKRKSLVDEL